MAQQQPPPPSLSALLSQVGITLHYSSLSTLLWMGVKARVLHKELTWRVPPPQEGDSAPPAPRPMLRYMLPTISFAVGKGSQGGLGHQNLFSQGGCRVDPRSGRPLSKDRRGKALYGARLPRPCSGCILRASQA